MEYIHTNYDIALNLLFDEGITDRSVEKIQALASNEEAYGCLDVATQLEELLELIGE